MKRTITESEFIDAFNGSYADSFSYEGKKALFEYFTELEDETGFEMELDVIAIHCEYTEYHLLTDFIADYEDYVKAHNIKEIDDIAEHTQLIRFDGGLDHKFIIQQFWSKMIKYILLICLSLSSCKEKDKTYIVIDKFNKEHKYDRLPEEDSDALYCQLHYEWETIKYYYTKEGVEYWMQTLKYF